MMVVVVVGALVFIRKPTTSGEVAGCLLIVHQVMNKDFVEPVGGEDSNEKL